MTETTEARQRLFTLRLSEVEEARFQRVAAQYGLTVAGVLRMLVKREDDAIVSPAARKTTKRASAKKGRAR